MQSEMGGRLVKNWLLIDGYLEGMADTVAFDEMMGQDPGGICDTLSGFGISCIPCPGTSPHQGDFCLFLAAENATCPLLPGTAMVEI